LGLFKFITDYLPYFDLSPPLIFPSTSTELGQKTARCESLQALLHYVEWDRFVTLAGAKADWDKKQFSNTKSIVKVETGIVTLISYHHCLKIEGNNKL
jgi:hypothetical protein